MTDPSLNVEFFKDVILREECPICNKFVPVARKVCPGDCKVALCTGCFTSMKNPSVQDYVKGAISGSSAPPTGTPFKCPICHQENLTVSGAYPEICADWKHCPNTGCSYKWQLYTHTSARGQNFNESTEEALREHLATCPHDPRNKRMITVICNYAKREYQSMKDDNERLQVALFEAEESLTKLKACLKTAKKDRAEAIVEQMKTREDQQKAELENDQLRENILEFKAKLCSALKREHNSSDNREGKARRTASPITL